MAATPLYDASLKPHYTDYIYALRHPETFDIFYVGKTQKPQTRLTAHITEAITSDKFVSKKSAIIKSIAEAGLKPIMSFIDKTDVRINIDKFHSSYKEIKWMQFYKEIGWNLTNFKDINSVLSSTDYLKYVALIKSRQIPPMDYYYYAKDKDGNPIYDLLKLKADGYVLKPPPLVENEYYTTKKPEYNPWDNPRFVKMLDLGEKSNEYWYRDTDPTYYDDDY